MLYIANKKHYAKHNVSPGCVTGVAEQLHPPLMVVSIESNSQNQTIEAEIIGSIEIF